MEKFDVRADSRSCADAQFVALSHLSEFEQEIILEMTQTLVVGFLRLQKIPIQREGIKSLRKFLSDFENAINMIESK